MVCVTLLWGFDPQFGRTIGVALSRRCFLLHEQRTGWSSRLGTERRWSRRAVYNNNTIRVTSREWQGARPMARPLRHQQHAIFGKWLHHRGTTAASGGRDFRRNSQFVVQKQDNEFTSFVFAGWNNICFFDFLLHYQNTCAFSYDTLAAGRSEIITITGRSGNLI